MTIDWRAILEVVLAGGFAAAATNLWLNRRKPEVDRGQLDIARSRNASDIYTADLQGLRDIIAELRQEVSGLRDEVHALETRVAALTLDRDRVTIERNNARDLARGLWGIVERLGEAVPFDRPDWL